MKKDWLIAILIAGVGIFYALTIREGHDWGGDNCQYLLHARNLAEGRPYTDIGSIYNPDSAVFPVSYPPVFPLILVPVYWAAGLSIEGAKFVVLLFFMMSLAAGARLLRKSESRLVAAAWVLAVGLSPYFWEFKDYGLSEIPFLFFLLLFFLVYRRETAAGALASGAVLYLAYGTRSAALLLIPAIFFYDWLKNRRPTRRPWLVLLAFAPLALLQTVFLHNDSVHIVYKLIWMKLSVVKDNLLVFYPKTYMLLWHNAVSHALGLLLGIVMLAFCVYGFWKRWRAGEAELFDIFTPMYLAAFVFIFFSDISPFGRYLVPALPFLIYYSISGIARASREFPKLKWLPVFMLIAASLSYGCRYSRLNWGPLQEGITGPAAQEVYAFIREKAAPGETVAFPDPRILHFFTGRLGAQYVMARTTQIKINYMLEQKVRYWVSFSRFKSFRHPQLKPVFSNAKYVIFELRPRS